MLVFSKELRQFLRKHDLTLYHYFDIDENVYRFLIEKNNSQLSRHFTINMEGCPENSPAFQECIFYLIHSFYDGLPEMFKVEVE